MARPRNGAFPMTIKSPGEWSNLAELVSPVIRTQAEKGSVYTVHKIGFLAMPLADCGDFDTTGVLFEAGRYFFPTADVEFGTERRLCRLPLQLSNWAIDTVAMAQTGEMRFPTKVEFGVFAGRHYAEML